MKKLFVGFLAILSVAFLGSCSSKEETKALTHAEYLKAEKGTTVTIEAYIQGKQAWWESDGIGVATFIYRIKMEDISFIIFLVIKMPMIMI